MGKVVTKTLASVQVWGVFNKTVMQLVLLYGSNSCVVMRAMLKLLEGFHYRVAIHIAGITAQRTTSVEWEWPSVVLFNQEIYTSNAGHHCGSGGILT